VSPPVTVTAPALPVITGQTAVCNGANALLTTTYTYTSYVWTPSGLTTDTVSVPANTYTVQVVDVNGCTLTSLPFTISPFNYTVSVSNIHPFCVGQSDTLLASSTNTGSLTPSYTWLPSGAGGVGHIITAGGTDTLVVTFPNGCHTDTIFNVPAVNPLPTPTITGPNFTCGSTPTTLTVTPTYSSYQWFGSSSTSDTAHVIAGIFQVTVTDANGCVGSSQPDTVINANPTVVISPDPPPSFCPGDSLILTANAALPGATFAWSNGRTTPTDVVHTSGTYIVTISYTNGCSAADSITVNEFNSPTAGFSETPPSTSPPLTNIQFTDLSTVSPGSIVYWVWNFGDGTPLVQGSVAATDQNPIHQYAVDGTYQVTLAVRDNNGCWDTIKKDYLIVSSISLPNVFTPGNPGTSGVNQYLYFKNLEFYPNTELQVYNRWGTKVYDNKDYHNDWNGGSYSDGTYYYILTGSLLGEPKYGFVEMIK
jgi:PKD repeat protein